MWGVLWCWCNSLPCSCADVHIRVTDSGPGLSPDQQERMFQEGVQFNANELQAGEGSGLGLWISREIVKQHNGVIGVKSEGLGKGATFSITIPVLRPLVSIRMSTSRRFLYRAENEGIREEGDIDGPMVELPTRVLVVDDAISSVKILSR